MKKSVRTVGIMTALAVMIPFSAYAATSTSGTNEDTKKSSVSAKSPGSPVWSVKEGPHGDRAGFGHHMRGVSQEVLDLLKLDQAGYQEKAEAGSTLAEIAEAQGVTRESLKSVMTEAFNKQLEERKADFTANLDTLIDSNSDIKAGPKKGMGGGFHRIHILNQDFTEAAKLLGLTVDQVKEQLALHKSLADLAEEKGVDVQKLIDAQKAVITANIKQAVTEGKLTQEQADKQLENVDELAEHRVNGIMFNKGIGGGKGRGFGGEKLNRTEAVESTSATLSL